MGTMALLFGCRSPSDHAYKDEVEEALNRGALTYSYTAYSRLAETPKVCKPQHYKIIFKQSRKVQKL